MSNAGKIVLAALGAVLVYLLFLRGRISSSGTVPTSQGPQRPWWQDALVRLSGSKEAQGAIGNGFGALVGLLGRDNSPRVPADVDAWISHGFDDPSNYG